MLRYVLSVFLMIPCFSVYAELDKQSLTDNPVVNQRVLLTQTPEWSWAIFWQQRLMDFISSTTASEIPDILTDSEHPLTVSLKKRNQNLLAGLQKVHQSPEGERLDWDNPDHKSYLKKLFSQYLPLLEKSASYKLIEQEIQNR